MCFDLLVPNGQEVGIEDPGELVDGWGNHPTALLAAGYCVCFVCWEPAVRADMVNTYMYICICSRSI